MNLSAFQTEVAAKLSLNLSDAAELALINQWINDGVAYVLGETEAKVDTATANLTAGAGDYDLDTAIFRILWIQTSGGREVRPAGPTEIRRRRLRASTSGVPYLYSLDGANRLRLYPLPSTADVLTIDYVPRPATLAAAGDVPSEIPTEFHRLVTTYALWQGGDYDDDQSSAQGARYKQLLDDGIIDMRSRLNKKRGRNLPPAVVTRRRFDGPRNDTDISAF